MVDRQRFADFDCLSQLLAVENLPAGELALAQGYGQVEIIAERGTVELVSSFEVALGIYPAHQGVEVLGFLLGQDATPVAGTTAHFLGLAKSFEPHVNLFGKRA